MTVIAGHVGLHGDNVADPAIVHHAADLHHLTDHLVAEDQGWGDPALRPTIPAVDVKVSPADRRPAHAQQHLIYQVLWYELHTVVVAKNKVARHHLNIVGQVAGEIDG